MREHCLDLPGHRGSADHAGVSHAQHAEGGSLGAGEALLIVGLSRSPECVPTSSSRLLRSEDAGPGLGNAALLLKLPEGRFAGNRRGASTHARAR